MKKPEEILRHQLIEKAKGKKDGVFTYGGSSYRVKDGKLTHYSFKNQILQVFGAFDVAVGRYEWSHEAKALLKSVKD
jgi:hypothetical protein